MNIIFFQIKKLHIATVPFETVKITLLYVKHFLNLSLKNTFKVNN